MMMGHKNPVEQKLFKLGEQLDEQREKRGNMEGYLREENAKLCEELATAAIQNSYALSGAYARARESEQRAEAAEARIKAASEQGSITHVIVDGDNEGDAVVQLRVPLYAKPVPPADVQELRRENAELREQIHQWGNGIYYDGIERIAELERKLAEAEASARQFEFMSKIRTKDTTIEQLAAEYQRGRADERNEAEKEEPVALYRNMGGGLKLVAYHVIYDDSWGKLYTRPLAAQKPLSEEALDLKEIQIDVYRNTTGGTNIVRALHLPTGISAECGTERSEHKNRAIALNMLSLQLAAHGITENKEG